MFEPIVAELNGFEVKGLTRRELCDVTTAMARVRGALDGLEIQVAAAVEGLDDKGGDAASMIRSHGRVSKREAARRARRAEELIDMPQVLGALCEGAICGEHADELAKAAAATTPELVDGDVRLLAEAKARPADMFAKAIRDWIRRHQSDAERQNRHRRQRQQRSLVIFAGDDDMTVAHCRTDTVSGEQLRARIDAVANALYRQDDGRDGDHPRSWDQLRHDALMIITGIGSENPRAVGHGSDLEDALGAKPAGSVRNQLMVVVDADVISGRDPNGRCEIPGVGPIPASVLQRLACDADIFGHIFAGDGTPLWHSRTTRTVSPQQWRTLLARDGGCVLCAAHPAYCEAHHIVPWALGGPTDIDNLALLCSQHHHHLHDHNQILIRGPDHWQIQPRAGPHHQEAAA